jgi:type VI secretion system secreted protein Hcp
MPSDYFLEIDGIKGESGDSKHKGEIELESWSWGVSLPRASAASGGGGGAGKVVFQDIHFTSRTSSASPQLFLSCATGQHIKKAVLTVRKAGGGQQEYYKVTLEDILVSSYQQGSPEGGDANQGTLPVDTFSLDFAKIELEYSPQKPDGSLDAPVKAGYDLKQNKKV